MERPTVIKTINGSLSQQPISRFMEQPRPYISFPQKAYLSDASFSSYLRPDDTNQADDAEISIFDARKYFNESGNDTKLSKRVSPVNVIGLERISERSDLLPVPRFSSASSVDRFGRNYRARSFNATPTASSEASWNSQTGLLSNPPGAIAVSMRNPSTDENKRSAAPKWLFGRNCPCAGKKSVQVEEKLSVSESKTPARLYNKKQTHKSIEISVEKSLNTSNGSERPEGTPKTHRIFAENRFPGLGHDVSASERPYADCTTGFTFPVLKQTPPMTMILNGLPSNDPSLDDPPRESLEIFQPSDEICVSRKSTDLQNRMLVSRHSFTFPASPTKTRMTDDDVASDASSDLFEIESFSTQSTLYPMYHRRDSLDEASSLNARRVTATNINGGLMYCRSSLDEPVTPSIAATECYEPSEASIDWSVTTAEGFDRGSVTNFSITASEIDQDTTTIRQENGGSDGSGKKKLGNGLLSCRCEKAVSVGPNPVKCVPEMQRMGQHNTLRHVSSRTHNVNKPPIARSQSDRLSLPFAT